MAEAFVVDVVRSPMGKGKPGGALSSLHAVELLAQTLSGLLARHSSDRSRSNRRRLDRLRQPSRRAGLHARSDGLARGGLPRARTLDDDRPALRLEPAGHDVCRARRPGRRLRPRDRRWHRVDEPGADGFGPDGHGPVRTLGDRTLRTRSGVAGRLRRTGRRQVEPRPRSARPILRPLARAGPRGGDERPLRIPDRADPRAGRDEPYCWTRRSVPVTTVEKLAALKPALRTTNRPRRFPEINWSSRPATPRRSPTAPRPPDRQRADGPELGLAPGPASTPTRSSATTRSRCCPARSRPPRRRCNAAV